MLRVFIFSMQINKTDPETVQDHDLEVLQRDASKKFKCDNCDFQTAYSSSLKYHSRKHTGERLQCQYCEYTTIQSGNLKAHSRKHTGEMLQCQYCEYSTVFSSSLKVHSRKHTATGK